MAIGTATNPRNMRGMGAYLNGTTQAGRDFRGAQHVRLPWTASNGEAITPGSGGVPNGVVGLAWEPDTADEAACAHWDADNGVGSMEAGGAYGGWLHVWFRRR